MTDEPERPEGEPGAPEPRAVSSVPEARAVTRARARDLRALVATYIRRHLPPVQAEKAPAPEPPRTVGAHAALLPVLRVIPWLLAALFLGSFAWDFDGVVLSPFGRVLELEGLLRILSVSGLIGFATNWLAITMLFNPRRRRPVFGQGLIPAQRERVIYRLARAVSDELINEEIIKQKIEEAQIIPRYRELAMSVTRGVLEDPDFRSDLKALTADYVERVLTSDQVRRRIVDYTIEKIEAYVGEGVGGLALKAYRYLNEEDFKRRIDKAIHQIPGSLDLVLDEMDAMLDRLPAKIEARAEDIEEWATKAVLGFVEQLDVYGMIMGNMARYDERQLEELLRRSTNEQLNYIKYLGGVLGFVGGLVIWEPVLSVVTLTALGLFLFGLDEGLVRLRGFAGQAG
jgi:uncharacterized membrane-anchored protein YjiN (DUF445 family)